MRRCIPSLRPHSVRALRKGLSASNQLNSAKWKNSPSSPSHRGGGEARHFGAYSLFDILFNHLALIKYDDARVDERIVAILRFNRFAHATELVDNNSVAAVSFCPEERPVTDVYIDINWISTLKLPPVCRVRGQSRLDKTRQRQHSCVRYCVAVSAGAC